MLIITWALPVTVILGLRPLPQQEATSPSESVPVVWAFSWDNLEQCRIQSLTEKGGGWIIAVLAGFSAPPAFSSFHESKGEEAPPDLPQQKQAKSWELQGCFPALISWEASFPLDGLYHCDREDKSQFCESIWSNTNVSHDLKHQTSNAWCHYGSACFQAYKTLKHLFQHSCDLINFLLQTA